MNIIKIAKLISKKELKDYFKGDDWKNASWDGDSFTGETKNLKVIFKPTGWKVEITAYDDPMDSEEFKTSDPVKTIDSFLKQGMPEISKTASLRRLAAVFLSADVAGYESIEEKLKAKGWKVEDTDDGFLVNIQDIYEAKISRLEESFEYEFIFKPDASLNESGKTDDPISSFKKWRRNDELQDALAALKAEKSAQYIPSNITSLKDLADRENKWEEVTKGDYFGQRDEAAPTEATAPPPKKKS